MNDREVRLECLRLAQLAAMNPGNMKSIAELAQEFYEFIWAGTPIGNRPNVLKDAA